MARHRFGDGRYRYFEHPLPDTIEALRGAFYAHLAPVANAWARADRRRRRSRSTHDELIERCARGRPAAADAADPALRRGRLERAAPGSLRRRLLPVPDPDRADRRARGRRVRADGEPPARAEPRARAEPAPGRVRDLPHPRAAGARQARLLQGRPAPRREHRDARADGRR